MDGYQLARRFRDEDELGIVAGRSGRTPEVASVQRDPARGGTGNVLASVQARAEGGSEEYRILVEQAPILIWRSRPDMLCDYFNERWLAFTGRTLEQEAGNGWAEGVHPEDFERCLEIYTSHFGRREVFEMEYRLRRHDGEYRWLFDRGVPFHTGDGAFGGYIGSCIDVTDGVLARQELEHHRQEEMARLQRLLPICAWCGQIRNDEGYWQRVDTYLHESGRGTVSHAICESCSSRVREGLVPGSTSR
jgi:PAS domain S-box-containing protein